jgi:pyruvate dehydrogenase E2 component (dihydrolipoamide acetyltransferase)
MFEVLMPQMGESVAEGTIVRWMKKVGEHVDKDEPLFEISTDKVDAEIPAPSAGVVQEIRVREGETVPVHTVVAVIASGDVRTETSGPKAVVAPPSTLAPPAAAGPTLQARQPFRVTPPVAAAPSGASPVPGDRLFSSPVVRAMARTHNVDLRLVRGSGSSGRITKRDMDAFLAGEPAARRSMKKPVYQPGDRVRIEKLTVMRRKIADHMVESLETSAHVYSAYEVDCSRIDALRRAHKSRYEQAGANLTYTAFITSAVARVIREFPYINASLDEDDVVYREDINVGIAVALEHGLIVPVVRNADQLTLLDLSKAIADLAERARTKRLHVDEVEGGTFTITNPGIFGGLWGLPIINQPQVAILAVGSIDKRAVVVGDEVVVRPMCYLTLGYDHRLVDGADGGRFLLAVKKAIEGFDESLM